jgi:hypothetical protein
MQVDRRLATSEYWQSLSKNIVAAFCGTVFSSFACSYENSVETGSVYSVRNSSEAHQATLNPTRDCEHSQQQLNWEEPNAKWPCPTSGKPQSYKCSLNGVVIENGDDKTKETVDLDFTLAISGEKVKSSLMPPASSFDYADTGSVIILSNDYPDADRHYLSKAVAYIMIDKATLSSIAVTFDLKENGNGKCSIAAR